MPVYKWLTSWKKCESDKKGILNVILTVENFSFRYKLIYPALLIVGAITPQSLPASHLPDINISTYLTPGPLPSPSVSRVESADARTDDETDENRVLVSLETPMSSSSSLTFEGLPRHLFVNSDISSFCQSNSEDESKIYHDDSKCFMDVYLPEAIQANREEVVISTDEMNPVQCSSKEENSPDTKYMNA